ncbi:MAG: hypothetical protein LKI65_05555 [Prevotella sp.]|nr:hypothetical protein [Prevotella sp.]
MDIATSSRTEAVGAPIVPVLNNGRKFSSSTLLVTSLKNWLCHALGSL